MSKKFIPRAQELVTFIHTLDYDLKFNFEHGNINQKACANLTRTVLDLSMSYLHLLNSGGVALIFGRSVIVRSFLETLGNAKHIENHPKRSKEYMDYINQVTDRFINKAQNNNIQIKGWTQSTIKQRVQRVSKEAADQYDLLSDFSHGNNLQVFYSDPKLAGYYLRYLDYYFCKLLTDFMLHMVLNLDLPKEVKDEIITKSTALLTILTTD